MRRVVVEPEDHPEARREAGEPVVRDIGLYLDVAVVDQGDDRRADVEIGADLGVAQGDDAVEGRLDLGVGEIVGGDPQVRVGARDTCPAPFDERDRLLDLGAGEVHLAHGGEGLLALVVEARLGERHRSLQAFEPRQLLAGEREPCLGAGDARLGHGETRLGVGQARLALGDLGRGDIAPPAMTIGIDDGEHVAPTHPVADLDTELGYGPGDARRHLAALPRHQPADHGEGLGQRLARDRIDLDQRRARLGGGRPRRRRRHGKHGDYGQRGNPPSPNSGCYHRAPTIHRGALECHCVGGAEALRGALATAGRM